MPRYIYEGREYSEEEIEELRARGELAGEAEDEYFDEDHLQEIPDSDGGGDDDGGGGGDEGDGLPEHRRDATPEPLGPLGPGPDAPGRPDALTGFSPLGTPTGPQAGGPLDASTTRAASVDAELSARGQAAEARGRRTLTAFPGAQQGVHTRSLGRRAGGIHAIRNRQRDPNNRGQETAQRTAAQQTALSSPSAPVSQPGQTALSPPAPVSQPGQQQQPPAPVSQPGQQQQPPAPVSQPGQQGAREAAQRTAQRQSALGGAPPAPVSQPRAQTSEPPAPVSQRRAQTLASEQRSTTRARKRPRATLGVR